MMLQKVYYHIICVIKMAFLKAIYGKHIRFGEKTSFRRRFNLMIEGNGSVEIGANCFFNHDCSIICRYKIKIGQGSLFGENVKIYDHNHRFSDTSKPIKEQGYVVGEISIGSHCWIGSNVILLKGCNIGNNCVIGAGCIISEKIPDNTIVKVAYKMDKIHLSETKSTYGG